MVLHGEHGRSATAMPQFEPSNSDTCVSITPAGSVWLSTVKPWFIEVIWTLPVASSFTGWFAPWWPWFILIVRAPRRAPDLVAQADAEDGHVALVQHLADRRHRVDARSRPDRPARSRGTALGPLRQHVLGRGRGGQHGHVAARRGEAAQDVALGAVVDGDHLAAGPSRRVASGQAQRISSQR
jgi:hypothetical protein